MNSLKKLIIWIIPHGIYNKLKRQKSTLQDEIEKIKRIPRYIKGTIDLPSHIGFEFIDNLSFVAQYTDFFQNEIYYFKIIDKKNPFIIDAGANIGLAIVYWKSIYPQSKIIGFEPDKEVFKVLQKNISRYKDVEIYNIGLYSSDSKQPFMREGADAGSIVIKNNTNRKSNTMVEVRKLSAYLNTSIDLLKIDIEGSEFEVLKECADLLANVDRIFVEYHSFLGEEQVLPELLQILKKAGFRLKLQNLEIDKKKPFEKENNYMSMDFQINIFGKKTKDQLSL